MSKLNQQSQSVNVEFPPVRPALDLRFALAKKLDPRVTFTRGTSGTYTGPDGYIKTAAANEPRFEHDPITGECKGLLMEQGRTNLISYSNEFDNAAWDEKWNISLIPNAAISPDGTNNAYQQIETTGGSFKLHRNGKFIAKVAQSKAYVFSVFVKKTDPRDFIKLEYGFYGSDGAVDLFTNFGSSNAPAIAGSYTLNTYGIIPYPNGWYRYYVSATTGTATDIHPFYGTWTTNTGNQYDGDGTSGIYVYGAQLEEGTYPTSYMPTTASQFSRGGDFAILQGTNFTNLFGDGTFDELSVFFSGFSPDGPIGRNPNSGLNYWRLSNLSRSNLIYHQYAGLPQFTLQKDASVASSVFTSSVDILNIKSMCLLNSKKIRLIINEFFPDYEFSIKSTVAIPPGIVRLAIGGAEDFDGAQINGTVERLTVYSKELSLNQAQSLTL